METLTNRTKGVVALFTCSAIYASFGPLVRVLADMFGTGAQVATRIGLAFIFLLIIGLLTKRLKKLLWSEYMWAAILGVVSTSIILFFTIAIIELKIASVIFLLYIASMVSSLILGTLIFKESLGLQKIGALLLAGLGLYFFLSADIVLGLSFGVLAALLSGVSEGIGNAIRKKLKYADRTMVMLVQFFVVTLCATVYIVVSGEDAVKTVSTASLLALVAFATFQLGLNYLLLYGFQNFDVNIGTVILSLELFFAAILGFIFFNETLSLHELLGGVIIFMASALSAWEFKKKVEV